MSLRRFTAPLKHVWLSLLLASPSHVMSATPSVVPPVNQLVVPALPYKAPPVVPPWPKEAPPALPRWTPSSSCPWPARRIAWPKIAPPPIPPKACSQEESFKIQQAFFRKTKWAFWTVRLIERHYNGVMSDAMHSQIVKLTRARQTSLTADSAVLF